MRACGGWEGAAPAIRDRAFDGAWAAAQRQLPRVVDRMVLGGGGAFHDFVLSCVASLSADVPASAADDVAFATEVVDSLDPGVGSAVYRLAYATALAAGYGAQPVFSLKMAANPVRAAETVVLWGVGSGIAMLEAVGGSARMLQFLERGCHALAIIGRFPNGTYADEATCANDMLALHAAVYDVAQTGSAAASPITYAYLTHGIYADLVNATQVGTAGLTSPDFISGALDALNASFARYHAVLANHSVGVPPVARMRHWVRMRVYMNSVFTLWAAVQPDTTDLSRWMTFVRVMFLVDGMQYTAALLEYEAAQASPAPALRRSLDARAGHMRVRGGAKTLGRPARPAVHEAGPLWVLDWSGTRAAHRAVVRATNASYGLVNAQLWKDCAWLAAQYLPSVVNARYMRESVDVARAQAAENVVAHVAWSMAKHAAHGTRAEGKAASMRVRVGDGGARGSLLPFFVAADRGLWRNAAMARQRQIVADGFGDGLDMPTYVANAYYRPERNDITLLAGVLQDVFLHPAMSNASRFGRLGAVVGHELTHAFDTWGILFDADGEFAPWLSQAEHEAEDALAACLLRQYREHTTPRWHTRVNAEATLDENMADVGGLRAAFVALEENTLASQGRALRRDEMEEFLTVYAQTWCTAETAEEERGDAVRDVHAPAMARVDGALRNLVDGQGRHVLTRLYRCEPGQPMRPRTVCGARASGSD
jgi:hypothetical protein